MSGNNYNYSGYYGHGQSQNVNQSASSAANTGYDQYSMNNGYSAGSGGYFGSTHSVNNTSARAGTNAYGTTGSGYNSRSGYDSSTVGNSAYNTSTVQPAQPTQPSRNYTATVPTYSQQYSTARQPTPTYSVSDTSYYHQQTRPESSNSSISTSHTTANTGRPAVSAANTLPRPVQPPVVDRASTSQTQYRSPNQYYQKPAQAQQAAYNGRTQSQPQSYTTPQYGEINNPVAQHRSSVTNNASATVANSHQTATAPESSTTTINPAQVYNPSHDWERQAKRAEAEAKQRAEERERQAALKAHEEREAQKKAEAQAVAQKSVASSIPTPAVEEASDTTASKKKSRKSADGTAPKRSRKKKTDSDAKKDGQDDPAQAAAMTLLQAANGESATNGSGNRTETDLEKQMREMFEKMREFNKKNPEMLSRLWQEERDNHLAAEAATETVAAAAEEAAQAVTTQQQEGVSSGPPKSRPKANTKVKAIKAVARTDGTATEPRKKKTKAKSTEEVGATVTQTPVTEQSSIAQQNSTAQTSLNQPQTVASANNNTSSSASANSTIWPNDKKASLAAAAVNLLMASNPGKSISNGEFYTLLDQNPTYLQLCELLKDRGFTIDRSKFAKALLHAVPDVNKPSTKQPPGAPADGSAPGAVSGAPVANMQAATNASLVKNAEARLMSGESLVGTPKQKAPRRRKTATPAKAGPSITTPASAIPASGTGVDGAIDLEGLDAVKNFNERGNTGEEASGKPAKAPKSGGKHRPSIPSAPLTKEGQARKRTFADLVDLTALSSEDEEIASTHFPKRQELDAPLPAIDDQDEPVQLPTPPNTVENIPAIPVVHGPRPPVFDGKLGPAQAPAQSSTYPTAPQPAPQNPVRLAPANVTVPSSAPRPPQPSITQQPGLPRSHPAHNTRMVQTLDRNKALRRSSYNPKTIARDVLLACGRHPDMRPLNAHLDILKTVFKEIDNNADLGTFRWDVADPGGPAPGSGAETLKPIDMYNDADDENDSDDDSVVGRGPRPAIRQAIGAHGGTSFESIGQNLAQIKNRPGRPRHSSGIRQAAATPTQVTGPASGAETPSGYSALRAQLGQQLDENGQPIKKKGRPVGWRKWMMKGGGDNYGNSPASAPSSNKPKPTRKSSPPEPDYQVYKCEWKDCGAELHNLATLRKHLHKLHGKPDGNGVYHCLWADCRKVIKESENGRTINRAVPCTFSSLEEWKKHVEKDHLYPIAWRLGDGPASGVSEPSEAELSEAYLSDAQGRRVTPRVVIPVQQAPAPHPQRSTAHEKALEVERQAAKRKRDIGIGIDKGGATLATDKRRQGFIDDAETSMVVDEDE